MSSLWLNVLNPDSVLEYSARGKGTVSLGCEGCPRDKAGAPKLLNEGANPKRKAILWFLSPDRAAAKHGQVFEGADAEWALTQLRKVGLKGSDFYTQYVVRCPTVKRNEMDELVSRTPNPEEIQHCSLHTKRALNNNGGTASVHVVFGHTTAEILCKQEFRRDRPVFWSNTLSAHVVVLDTPSILRHQEKGSWRLAEFRERLKAAAWLIHNGGERWAFVEQANVRIIKKLATVRKVLAQIAQQTGRTSVDIETGKVDGETKILCIGLSWQKDKSVSIVLDHPENTTSKAERRKIRELLAEFLGDKTAKKVMHYGCFDTHELQADFGIKVRGFEYDTLYAHYLKYSFLRAHGLEAISNLHYSLYAGYKQYITPHIQDGNYATIPLKILCRYNGMDAALTKRIEMGTRKDISLSLLRLYTQTSMTLFEMESRGPRMDLKYFERINKRLPSVLKRLEARLKRLADDPDFNPRAPDQVKAVLYDRLGLEYPDQKTHNTANKTLQMLVDHSGHPFPKLMLRHRKLEKMVSTYLKGYRKSAELNDGELRTKWYLDGAATGRLRSGGKAEGLRGKTNLQNLHGSAMLQNLIISDHDWREVLKWKPGQPIPDVEVLLALDHSQIEIRMLGECSEDKVLIAQFKKAAASKNPSDPSADIHCLVGNVLNRKWSLEYIKRTKKVRTFIKQCHFGMVYGLDPVGLFYYLLAFGVKTTQEKVNRFYKRYFKNFRGVGRFIRRMREFWRKHKFVESIFGFRRFIGTEFDPDRTTDPENQCINTPIQGSAHILLLIAMALLTKEPRKYKLLRNIIMEVHDALVWRVKLRQLPEAYRLAKNLMEVATKEYVRKNFGRELKVPLLTECTAGFRYGVLSDYSGQPVEEFLKNWLVENEKKNAEIFKEYRIAA